MWNQLLGSAVSQQHQRQASMQSALGNHQSEMARLQRQQGEFDQARKQFPGATMMEVSMAGGERKVTVHAPTRIPQHPRQVTDND